MGARNEHEIQMQASNHRSLWSAEASVRRSKQDGSLASEALRELKRAGAELWVVRESSTFFFSPPLPQTNMDFPRWMGKRRGRGHSSGRLAVIFSIVWAVRNGIRTDNNRLASAVGFQYERAAGNGTTRQHSQMVFRLVVVIVLSSIAGAVRNGTTRTHRHIFVDSRWPSDCMGRKKPSYYV